MPIIQRIEVRCDLMGFWLFYFMENEVEIWKDVVEFEGFYKVSNFGNVYSCFLGKNLKPSNDRGYKKVLLSKNCKRKNEMVHRLVALAFIDSDYIKKGLVCNHIDRIRDNNNVNNLEIVTTRYNVSFAKGTGINTGVTFLRGRYDVKFVYMRKTYHLGSFFNKEEAHEKYLQAVMAVEQNTFCFEQIKKKVTTITGVKNIRYCRKRNVFFPEIVINKKSIRGSISKSIDDAKKELARLCVQNNYKDKIKKLYTESKLMQFEKCNATKSEDTLW